MADKIKFKVVDDNDKVFDDYNDDDYVSLCLEGGYCFYKNSGYLGEDLEKYNNNIANYKKLFEADINNKNFIRNFQTLIYQDTQNTHYVIKNEGFVLNDLMFDARNCFSGSMLNLSYLNHILDSNIDIVVNEIKSKKIEGKISGHIQTFFNLNGKNKIIESTIQANAIRDYKIGNLTSLEDVVRTLEPKTGNKGKLQLFSNLMKLLKNIHLNFVSNKDLGYKSKIGMNEVIFSDKRIPIDESETVSLEDMKKIDPIGNEINIDEKINNQIFSKNYEEKEDPIIKDVFFSLSKNQRDEFLHKLIDKLGHYDNRLSKEEIPIFQENLPSYKQVFQAIKTGKTDLEFNILHQNFNTKQFLSHYKFMKSDVFKESKNQKKIKSKTKKLKQETLDSKIFDFLTRFSDFNGTAAIISPNENFDNILQNILDNKYEISEKEKLSSKKSNRKLLHDKTNIFSSNIGPNKKLEERLNVLEDVFIGEKSDKKFEVREQYEKDSFINYNTSIQNGGKTGLSQGIIKDSVDFFGEEEAIEKLDKYLQRDDLEIKRDEYYKILKNYNLELYYEKSVEKLEDIIKDEFDNSKDINLKLASAKYLHKKNKIDNQKLNKFYINYLKSHKEIDVNLIEDLLNSGLEKNTLENYLNSELNQLNNLKDLVGLNYEENNLEENVKVFNNLEKILMIADNLNLDNLKEKVYDINLNYMKDFIDFSENNNENLNYGNLLNAIQLTNSKEFSDGESLEEIKKIIEFGKNNNAIRLLAPLIQKRSKAFDIIIEKINNEIEIEKNKNLINGVNIIKKNTNMHNQDEARIYFKDNKDFFEKTLNRSNILNLLFYKSGWYKHKLKKFFDVSNTCLEFTLLNSIRKEETIIFNDLKDNLFDSAYIKLLSNFDKDFEKSIIKNLSFYTPTKFLEKDVSYGNYVFNDYIKNLIDKANFNFNFDRLKVRTTIEENLYYILSNNNGSYSCRDFYNKRIYNNLSRYENYYKFSYDYLPENISQDFIDSFKENLNYNLYTSDTNSFINGLFLYKHGFLKLNDNKDGFTPTQKGIENGF